MLDTLFGKKFERFCLKEVVPRLFPIYRQIGRWWVKEEEIDIIALNEKDNEIFFIEYKWSNIKSKKAENIVRDLRRKAELIRWKDDVRKEKYGIIARRINQKEILKNKGYLSQDLEDIINIGI